MTEWRGVCRVYIGVDGVKWTSNVGSSTFTEIFVRSPTTGRFAIVEVPTDRYTPLEYRVYDMWLATTKRTQTKITFFPPATYSSYDDLDVAVAATVMINTGSMGLLPQLERVYLIRGLVRALAIERN